MQVRTTLATVARTCATAALWSLPALALAMPSGLAGFGLLMLAALLLSPLAVARAVPRAGWPLAWATFAALLAVAVCYASMEHYGMGFRDIDSRTRLVALPLVALTVFALRPPARALWWGAACGLIIAAGIGAYQLATGAERASGFTNAIVFADVLLVLICLVVFLRPAGRVRWTLFLVTVGIAAIVMSGSRGVWPGLLVIAAASLLSSKWKTPRIRVLVLAATAAMAVGCVLAVPPLTDQTRMVELRHDMDRYARGDIDSSFGARIALMDTARDAFVAHPWAGVGVGRFELQLRQQPYCEVPVMALCRLGHAHNDIAEWAATMGLPGIVAIVLLYGIPLAVFLLLALEGDERRRRGPARAGVLVVVVLVLCGMTQSMFAHQLSASMYACTVGVLLGLALRERHERRLARRSRAMPAVEPRPAPSAP